MADKKKRSSMFEFALVFLALYLGVQLLIGLFFPPQTGPAPVPGPVVTVASFTIGGDPVAQVQNKAETTQSFGVGGWVKSSWCSFVSFFTHASTPAQCSALAATHTGKPYTLPSRCPAPPFDVYTVTAHGEPGEKITPLAASGALVVPCVQVPVVMPGATETISLNPWKYSLFGKAGMYEVRLPGTKVESGTGGMLNPAVARFAVSEPGVFTKLFRTFISAPFLNFLILIASVTPGHNLGIAIILLTLVVKILLFFPTQHALEGQKKMQMLQPKLEALKTKYDGDQKKIQEETMKLWQENKINPFQSCLPLLIQFPILIGLLYVIRDGSNLAVSQHLIYPVYAHLPWHFGTGFLWLDLLKPDIFVLPILLVVLQFLQMKLSFSIQKRKKKSEVIDVGHEKKKDASPQDMQQKLMLYGLPLMIGFLAIKFPAAVALYWGISTIFGIGQQMIVNREHLRVRT